MAVEQAREQVSEQHTMEPGIYQPFSRSGEPINVIELVVDTYRGLRQRYGPNSLLTNLRRAVEEVRSGEPIEANPTPPNAV